MLSSGLPGLACELGARRDEARTANANTRTLSVRFHWTTELEWLVPTQQDYGVHAFLKFSTSTGGAKRASR